MTIAKGHLLRLQQTQQKLLQLTEQQQLLQHRLDGKILQLLHQHNAYMIDFATLYGAIFTLLQQLQNSPSACPEINKGYQPKSHRLKAHQPDDHRSKDQ